MNNLHERATGELFGSLWHKLSDEQYRQSVELFARRFDANGFDLNWFKGKSCLDVGTGSGRYAVAMALCGADVTACDISVSGLETARQRARDIADIRFVEGSALDLPFESASFDFVCCAGVLHHTESIERGLDELTRVLRPDGKLFVLLYGAGGLRWKLVTALRPLAEELGYDQIDDAISATGLPANNRKHFLDDLFVPIQTLTAWVELEEMLPSRGYAHIDRWTGETLDHESSADAQIEDMEKLLGVFSHVDHPLGRIGVGVSEAFISEARANHGDKTLIIGEGNHRVIASR